ncbi:MAG: hypothetical protein GY795_11360 [Desulfobacterales bacterium]|nr:hypothetical protein [Desulfobacterales bacterium]
MNRVKTILTVLLGIIMGSLFMVCTVANAEEILVIANPNVPSDSLDRGVISGIYHSRKTKWDNGNTILVAMLKKGVIHEKFARNIAGSTPAKLKNIWKKVIFTGTGRPPKIFRQESDMVRFVADTKGAIGYISASTPHEGVKVISIK